MEQGGQKRYYKPIWSKKAKKNLNKIDPTQKVIITYKVDNKLAYDPYGKMIDAKKMKGKAWKEKWRYRTGNYRVIYKIYEKEIYIDILEVDDRKDIYG
ncbi:MAG: hypothetical protein MRERV_9c060 [Mycoplasmataceae bacterium RV_VA103A]|nr:MAG: hypothetical protein MRERV_9c060 [Mycoplasmataceae bacterium RV_VA103A]